MDNTIRILLVVSSGADELCRRIGESFSEARLLCAVAPEDVSEAFRLFKPDIVLAECSLRGSEAENALRRVITSAPMVPLICLSDQQDEALIAACMEAGAWSVINRSWFWRIEIAIRRCIKQKAMEGAYHKAMEALRDSEERYRSISEVAPVAIVILIDGIIRYINPMGVKLFGAETREQVIGAPISTFVPAESLDAALDRLRRINAGEAGLYPIEDTYLRVDGSRRRVEVIGTLLRYEDQLAVQVIITDITERKKAEEDYKYLSYHDYLTGLYNRRYFEEELRRADMAENLPISVVMGDVNGLKEINDTLGHDAGDKIIVKMSEVIRKGCRDGDIVARIGGDEFAVLLTRTKEKDAEAVLSRISSFAREEQVCGRPLSISLGCAVKNTPEDSIADILTRAENIMYARKRAAHVEE